MSAKNQFLLFCFIQILLSLETVKAQDSLPAFTVKERNGMVIIGWLNPHPELTQLIIQRSVDSLTGFRSIVSMPDPTSVSNGYLDKKPGVANIITGSIMSTQEGGIILPLQKNRLKILY